MRHPVPRLRQPSSAALDRTEWATGFSIRAYGLKIGFRINRRGFHSRFKAALLCPGMSLSNDRVVDHLYSIELGPAPDSAHAAYSGNEEISHCHGLNELLTFIESDLRLFVAAHAKGAVFLHAGVVGWKGRAIVIP